MSIINFHRIDKTNPGDKLGSPIKYFDFPKNTKVLEIESVTEPKNYQNDIVIIGGGGLLSDFFEDNLENIIKSKPKKLIGWGIGHNYHGLTKINSFDLDSFDLVGLRDYGFGETWVPCPTCMSPLFDKKYNETEDIVVAEHARRPLDIRGYKKISFLNKELEDIIPFLGSAKVVVTNTYHGVYWATLLNKKVIIVNPFSSKFYGLKHKHPMASYLDWETKIKDTENYPNALKEAREACQMFYDSIKEELFNIQK